MRSFALITYACSLIHAVANAAPWVGITTAPSNINITANILDAVADTGQTTFVVKADRRQTKYDIWISVANRFHEPVYDVYTAQKNQNYLPFTPRLTGNTGNNRVDVNPAALQTTGHNSAHPTTGNKIDGDGVRGTNSSTGTTYTFTLTEANHLANVYDDVPANNYRINFRVNVQLDD